MSISSEAHGALPCPFCGNGRVLVSKLFCHCPQCGAAGPGCGDLRAAEPRWPTIPERVGAWNRRVARDGDGFWYLATSYSGHPDGLFAAFTMAAQAKGLLMQHGIRAFSPIVHSHPVAMICGRDPLDYSIWMPDDEPYMRAARGLIVLRDGNWQESKGIAEEIDAFRAQGKPMMFMDPGRVPVLLRATTLECAP